MNIDFTIKYEIEEDGKYQQVFYLNSLGGLFDKNPEYEKVWCGTVSTTELGKFESGHLPLGIGEFDSLEDIAKALVLLKIARNHKCRCGSMLLTGIEYRGSYDGVAEWKCNRCGYVWDRFTGKEVPQPVDLTGAAEEKSQ